MTDLRLADLPPEESRELYKEARDHSRNTGVRRFLVTLSVLVGLMLLGGVLVIIRGSQRYDELNDRLTNAEQRADDNAGAAQALATQVEQLGQEPIVEAPSAPPEAVPTAAAAVTQDQVNAAVNAYFAVNPPAAPSPTAAEVTKAVAAVLTAQGDALLNSRLADAVAGYFATRPPLPGPQGETGPAGAPGATGATGPPPDAAAIAEAVSEYCATQPGGSCEGAMGPTGPPPYQWTWVEQTLTGPVTHTCTREPADSDPPTYTCTSTGPR